MTDGWTMRPIAHVRSDFPSKFGVPRQSGMVPQLVSRVVFEPEFRSVDAVRGIQGFSHLWLVWVFDKSVSGRAWSPTVRPPRLGGQERLGVFATRSPFRPNPIGLSSVELLDVKHDGDEAPVLVVGGADLVDGTPVLDVKPWIATDGHPGARTGFVAENPERPFTVEVSDELLAPLDAQQRASLLGVLCSDPRPRHMDDPSRVFGLPFGGWDVRFSVADRTVRVHSIAPLQPDDQTAWPGYR